MKKYIVKTKYTYEKFNQRDYSYSDRTSPSNNRIFGRYIYNVGETVGAGVACANKPYEESIATDFSSASGICIKAEGGAGICRVIFFGKTGESFMSVCELSDAQNGVCYSTLGMSFSPVRMRIETMGEEQTEVKVSLCNVLNPLGEWGGQSFYYTSVGALCDRGEKMCLSFDGEGSITSPDFPDRSDTAYNMLMPVRNTICAVLGNECSASKVRCYFTTYDCPENGEYVELPLASDTEPHMYYFNLSTCASCRGRLKNFRLEAEGHGELVIYRYSFEQEEVLWDRLAEDISCVANKENNTVSVKGRLVSGNIGEVCLYETCMRDESNTPENKTLVGKTCDIGDGGEFFIEIPLYGDIVSRLSGQFVLFSGNKRLSDRFYVENYEDFEENPYHFDLPEYEVSVLDFGAYGDAYHDDTQAIQNALDHVSSHGGGRVVLPGEIGIYGRRYIVTNILLPSNTELHFEDGAILWQSQIRGEYPYAPSYGHDAVVPGIYWTHSMHVSNLPLLQVANSHHVKITGRGKIRAMDTGSEEGVDMKMSYSTGCADRIHLTPLGVFGGEYVECRDFEIVRCNNYHSAFYHCEKVYCGNLKYHEVKCLSGDGFGLIAGTHDVLFTRCFFQSNDDCIVLTAVYNDPRGILWWTNTEDGHCAPYNIKLTHSYIDAHTGGGIAFITWATCDPCGETAEIYGIEAYDNYFGGQKAIGGWFDNPYKGKVPFDNSEVDDYSPVRGVRLLCNRYTDFVTLGPVHATDFISDCGLHSYHDFVNGDFTLGGLANWTAKRNSKRESVDTLIYCNKEKGSIGEFDCGDVSLSQGLYLRSGKYTFECEFMGKDCQLFVSDILSGEIIGALDVECALPATVCMDFELTDTRDVYVGVRNRTNGKDGFGIIDRCKIIKKEV